MVAIAFIFLYPVGVPACFGALLFWNRRMLSGNLSGGDTTEKWWYGDGETLDFLVDGYRQETFWFEEVEFLRKLLMAGARRTAHCIAFDSHESSFRTGGSSMHPQAESSSSTVAAPTSSSWRSSSP